MAGDIVITNLTIQKFDGDGHMNKNIVRLTMHGVHSPVPTILDTKIDDVRTIYAPL